MSYRDVIVITKFAITKYENLVITITSLYDITI